MERSSVPSEPATHRCPDCPKTFALKKKLNLHRKLCHLPDLQPHVCNLCQKAFKVDSNLRRHRRSVHEKQSKKSAECHFCDYKCRDQFQLAIHLRKHTRERSFPCDLCSRLFASRADALRHRRSCTTTALRNNCPMCSLPFHNIQLLNRHYLWDAQCGRLRHLNIDPVPADASLEIFRLQTEDSDNDIVGARLRPPTSGFSDDVVDISSAVGNHRRSCRLVPVSQRRVKCGVCISCSRSRKCLHPVNYYKVDESDERTTSSKTRQEENLVDLPSSFVVCSGHLNDEA